MKGAPPPQIVVVVVVVAAAAAAVTPASVIRLNGKKGVCAHCLVGGSQVVGINILSGCKGEGLVCPFS